MKKTIRNTHILMPDLPFNSSQPFVCKVLGDNEGRMIQYIHSFLDTNKTNKKCQHDGKVWMFHSYDDFLKDDFCFWSKNTIIKTLKNLQHENLLITGHYNERKGDKTTWYTLNYDELNKRLGHGGYVQAITIPIINTAEEDTTEDENSSEVENEIISPTRETVQEITAASTETAGNTVPLEEQEEPWTKGKEIDQQNAPIPPDCEDDDDDLF